MSYLTLCRHALPNTGHLWLLIKQTEPDQRHCGLLYKRSDGLRFLHLAWHFDLRDGPAPDDYFWLATDLDDINQLAMAGFCVRLARAEPAIPYGFNANGLVFDEDGSLQPPPVGHGMTCASFVSGLFARYGFPLVDLETWPARDSDQEWRDGIIEKIVTYKGDLTHAEELKTTPAESRLRPEEIVGAATYKSETWPISFSDALERAKEILIEVAEE